MHASADIRWPAYTTAARFTKKSRDYVEPDDNATPHPYFCINHFPSTIESSQRRVVKAEMVAASY